LADLLHINIHNGKSHKGYGKYQKYPQFKNWHSYDPKLPHIIVGSPEDTHLKYEKSIVFTVILINLTLTPFPSLIFPFSIIYISLIFQLVHNLA
jgi:hypothetical protein